MPDRRSVATWPAALLPGLLLAALIATGTGAQNASSSDTADAAETAEIVEMTVVDAR